MKKAQTILSVIMLLAFIGLLSLAVVRMNMAESRTETIGETTLELKQTYEEAEKALFYLEQSAQYVIYDIVEEIKTNTSICNQTHITSIGNLFEQKLKIYISHYPNKDINFPIDNNYKLTIINNQNLIIANAKSDLIIKFSKGEYSINPSFSLKANYNFSRCTQEENVLPTPTVY